MEFIRLGDNGTTYADLLEDWRRQCQLFGEDFETYSAIPISVFDEIMAKDKASTGLYAVKSEGGYDAICMVNHTLLPGYDGPVLRVRHILLSPTFDFSDVDLNAYRDVLVELLNGVMRLSDDELKANHIKFHTRSPTDMNFFATFGKALGNADVFRSIQMKGTWLYVTKS